MSIVHIILNRVQLNHFKAICPIFQQRNHRTNKLMKLVREIISLTIKKLTVSNVFQVIEEITDPSTTV